MTNDLWVFMSHKKCLPYKLPSEFLKKVETGPLVFSLSGWVGSKAFGCASTHCKACISSPSLSYLADHKSHDPFPSTVEILLSRQKKAELLKKMTDVAVRMSEEQLVELRADIKVKLPSLFCLSSYPRGLK